MLDLEGTRERLREWARIFRDRQRQGSAGSAERKWASPQVWESPRPRPVSDVLRAERTQDLLAQLPHQYHRALSWRYVAPWLPPSIALRALTRRLGRRITMKEYGELIDLGEIRLAHLIAAEEEEALRVAELRELIGRAVGEKEAPNAGL